MFHGVAREFSIQTFLEKPFQLILGFTYLYYTRHFCPGPNQLGPCNLVSTTFNDTHRSTTTFTIISSAFQHLHCEDHRETDHGEKTLSYTEDLLVY